LPPNPFRNSAWLFRIKDCMHRARWWTTPVVTVALLDQRCLKIKNASDWQRWLAQASPQDCID
jgi:hypothetical protein